MLNKKEIVEIEKTLARFQEGDLYSPVRSWGYGEYHAICTMLESLRLSMLKLKDGIAETSTKTNKTIASVAHDMKTPLAIISGYAECMSDGMDDKDYPALIIQKAQQMNEMVIGMVESSNAEIKKQSEHKTLHATKNMFGKIIEKLRPLATAKNIKLKVGKIPDVNVRVDERQMERVVQNLVSNAVKYSPEKSVVKITARKRGREFILSVKDKGIGISKESLPYVFDQFYTEDKARSAAKSQGVGLYVVSEIMKEHGGSVSVKSKKDKGSKFSISLPIEYENGKLTATEKFDNMPLFAKALVEFFLGWAMTFVYRFAKYSQTRQLPTLIAAIASFALFVLMWPIDFISVAVYGKPTFLAD